MKCAVQGKIFQEAESDCSGRQTIPAELKRRTWLVPVFAIFFVVACGISVLCGVNQVREVALSKESVEEGEVQDAESPKLSENRTSVVPRRLCTMDQLLPLQTEREAAPEWSTEFVTDAPFNCTCPFYKARYYCPDMGSKGYPKWIPQSVTDGTCELVPSSKLIEAPFPSNFTVLYYGNSHMRQILESTLCSFRQSISKKRVNFGKGRDVVVTGNTQCRTCTHEPDDEWDLGQQLVDHHCMAEGENCKCSDSQGEFYFTNGAVVHYYFANSQEDKRIELALDLHGGIPLSFYDVVIANNGNPPRMETESLLKSAEAMHDVGVQLIWLTPYGGEGNVADWNKAEKKRFAESGAKFVPVEYMVRGLELYRKGKVEPQMNPGDPHYCLPGPPDEIGLLLLQLVRAMSQEHQN